jgi:YggT family protein
MGAPSFGGVHIETHGYKTGIAGVHVPLLIQLIDLIFFLYSLAIIARTWLPRLGVSPYHPVMNFLFQITEPLLAPLRRHIPPMGMIDITPLVAIILLLVVELIVKQILRMLIML